MIKTRLEVELMENNMQDRQKLQILPELYQF